ncbi:MULTISPECIES: biotin--[acetyl-CoA-carboxylase] ligase [unclassified Enterococcus]|uniref:biotin--[acetyl-CoA-carboxylase] ligase n=1 Tax=unclassified Enterococcus TaxID=2608891 RepID=UPI00155366F0|nr:MULTISPECIES: biotin--[acetyl-CoA-carboxylase] ligase [unclassified Enterococcus]MBS7577497.1 biotin--[acetyl-CoA-carboxylase] ligase [Enterococcus sp. MMGLQ5-2]MBS7585004.1 biotin--[acetyl-CoA-carboxylase] ligase [Enterococcus sp. MMGLQ5-1]NPD12859.1 biotin--[acetyl-CoA-carboxylase] ligase [Enterococcus sp. MMGLQ5-1]NPD37330.1 biotin--[acetyl-CoA-carboxylase] ligase [Enterococcus sp. MMGLQ5-2]
MNQTTRKVYLALLNQKGQAVSGEKIAESLGISRTAIWKSIQELKNLGYQIDSIKGSGYLLGSSDILNPDEIKHLFNKNNLIDSVFLVENSESTQEDAKSALLKNTPNYALFIARNQTVAHGRFKRAYYTETDHGIYMSLAIKPEKSFQEMPQYTILTAVAIVTAIKKLTQIEAKIKWVNDIYLNQKKMAGILSEATTNMESGQINHVIIGIGLNFAIQQESFPVEIQDKATSLFADGQPTITKNQLIAEIWNTFFELINQPFIDDYRRDSFILGKNVSFIKNGIEYQGIANDISQTGELIVTLKPSNEQIKLSSGEISLKHFEH